MGNMCGGKTGGAAVQEVPQNAKAAATSSAPVTTNKKYVRHDGEHFKSDQEAEDIGNAWCAMPENAGWVFKGKHKMEISKEGKKASLFEVVKANVPAAQGLPQAGTGIPQSVPELNTPANKGGPIVVIEKKENANSPEIVNQDTKESEEVKREDENAEADQIDDEEPGNISHEPMADLGSPQNENDTDEEHKVSDPPVEQNNQEEPEQQEQHAEEAEEVPVAEDNTNQEEEAVNVGIADIPQEYVDSWNYMGITFDQEDFTDSQQALVDHYSAKDAKDLEGEAYLTRFQEFFEKFDTNSNGFLVIDEFKKFVEARAEVMTEEIGHDVVPVSDEILEKIFSMNCFTQEGQMTADDMHKKCAYDIRLMQAVKAKQ